MHGFRRKLHQSFDGKYLKLPSSAPTTQSVEESAARLRMRSPLALLALGSMSLLSRSLRLSVGARSRRAVFRLESVSSIADDGPAFLADDKNNGPHISWYPGHIAKAERELAEYLKKVDVVIEVRDARIPLSTTHPKVPEWVGSKPLIVAIARLDQISPKALADWREYYAMNPAHKERPDAKVFFIDGKVRVPVHAPLYMHPCTLLYLARCRLARACSLLRSKRLRLASQSMRSE